MRELRIVLAILTLSLALGFGIALTLVGDANASGTCPEPPVKCAVPCSSPILIDGDCCPDGYLENWSTFAESAEGCWTPCTNGQMYFIGCTLEPPRGI